jgi:predicted dienelactone hydrolase
LAVSSITVALADPSRPTVSKGQTIAPDRALTTELWYPTRPGRWPLVVLAHGFAVGPAPYEHLCRSWAAAGYVVAAPRFPLTDAAVAGSSLDEADVPNQSGDVVFVVRALTGPTSTVATRIDPARVAVAGHSDGGETALAAARATPSLRAVIAMSAAPVAASDGHNPPLLAIQGDADPINPPADGYAVYEMAKPPRFLLRLLGGGHLPPFDGTTVYQPIVERVTIDFLDRYVAGRSQSAAALLHDAGPPLATIDGTG